MRALSVHQPYTSLIVNRLKVFETREWATDYRGYLAIHATKRWTKEETRILDMIRRHYPVESQVMQLPLPLSAVLCVVRLVDVLPTDAVRPHISVMERSFGNFEPNRFAWQMEVVEVFDPPYPAKGERKFWRWDKPA